MIRSCAMGDGIAAQFGDEERMFRILISGRDCVKHHSRCFVRRNGGLLVKASGKAHTSSSVVLLRRTAVPDGHAADALVALPQGDEPMTRTVVHAQAAATDGEVVVVDGAVMMMTQDNDGRR